MQKKFKKSKNPILIKKIRFKSKKSDLNQKIRFFRFFFKSWFFPTLAGGPLKCSWENGEHCTSYKHNYSTSRTQKKSLVAANCKFSVERRM